jgi:hypothetical protein
MKTIKLITVGLFMLLSNMSQSQVDVSINIGTPPPWGPVGYAEVEYYYLPDVEAYYDIRASQFIYYNRGGWIRSRYLPSHYRRYDLYNGYKVVLNDYHGHAPYTHFKTHKGKYHKGYTNGLQKTIGAKKSHDKGPGNKGNGHKGHGNKGHGKK